MSSVFYWLNLLPLLSLNCWEPTRFCYSIFVLTDLTCQHPVCMIMLLIIALEIFSRLHHRWDYPAICSARIPVARLHSLNIILFCDNVSMEFHGQDQPEFKGTKSGRLYLTTHRMVFNAKDSKEKMQSFSFPFVTLSDVELEQPVFGANYIKGKVRAQPNGNWIGEVKFKLMFKSGGAIEFGQAMLKAAQMASRNGPRDSPPPYAPPSGPWYAAPPPAYTPPPAGYYGWMPPTHVFPSAPPPNTVFMTDMPPPYPGINGYNGYATAPPAGAGAVGFTQPPSAADAKAAEAAQSAYYDPNQPQCAYVPPPAYYEPPPTYQSATGKKTQ